MSRSIRIARDAVSSLRANPQRTALMMIGVIVAVTALSAVIVTVQGTRERITALVNKHGLDMVMVRAGGDVQVFAPTADRGLTVLMESDARAIESSIPNVRIVSAVQNKRGITAVNGDRSIVTRGFGVEPDWIDIRRWAVAEGEFLTADDAASVARVTILGQKVARALFPDGGAVGSTIRVNNDPYTVKGVFIEMGVDAGGDDWDHRLVVPLTTSSRRLFERPYLEQIVMLVDDPAKLKTTAEQVRDLLRVRHGMGPGKPDDFFVREPADVEGAAVDVSWTLWVALLATAFAALVASGIVVMNVMLLSVAQRKREIALRRAVGARAADVSQHFLLESVFVVLIGGLIGAILGVATAKALALAGVASAAITWLPFGAAVVLCATIGLAFGVAPARRAALVDPAASLRDRAV
jgi:ABC-type antimicrobial peptide transport system permease subunit